MTTRTGSLCSGYGGLDIAANAYYGADTAWFCEYDAAPSKILAHHWPTTPNHHDLTTVDWDTVEPVDILTAGYPCQPFSAAGRRQGTNDERHLWPYVRKAIRHLRPRYVVLENVAGHRSLGFDRVLGDMAEDGLHARWVSVRASDVGACHRRERLFILATPAGAAGDGWHEGWAESAGLVGRPDAAVSGDTPVALLPTPTTRDHKGQNQRGDTSCLPGALLPTPRATDGTKGGPNQRGSSGDLMLPSAVHLLPTVEAKLATNWGDYEPAIRRAEQAMGEPAPPPTEPSSKGNPRLSAAFAEWMMGLPAGHVTAVPGLSRNEQLKALGNGVVPAQALHALMLLNRIAVAS